MKHILLILFTSCFFLQSGPCIAQLTKKTASVLIGVFDGRTPCDKLAGQLEEKVTTDCIKIKWRLTLYKNPVNGNSGTYELIGFRYKKDKPRPGTWQIINGTKVNPQAIVYQLNQTGKDPILLQKADDNVLFFLDKEKKLMVGNKDFSYTLNRKL